MNAPIPSLHFFERPFPSANVVLIGGERPILVDTGFGSDLGELEHLLRKAQIPPASLSLIVNTHYHADHVGGNYGLQTQYDVPIAAHRWEAHLINRRDSEACSARWLDQPVEPYHVDRFLVEDETVSTGTLVFRVLHTPGHTLGHVSLYEPNERILICGDAVHSNDVAWLNPYREGVGAIERTMESIERLLELDVRWACSGHGPAITEPDRAFRAALARYERWLDDPERAAWHAVKRIFAYALMIEDGLTRDAVEAYLLNCPWFRDFSRYSFGMEPADFVDPLLAEMLRSSAAQWQGDRLMALTPYTPPPKEWPQVAHKPDTWPAPGET